MEAARLEEGLKQAQATLSAATKLLDQLSGENERWQNQVKTLDYEMSLVPTRALLSSAYLTYLGSQNENIRSRVSNEWMAVLRSSDFSFNNFLSSEA